MLLVNDNEAQGVAITYRRRLLNPKMYNELTKTNDFRRTSMNRRSILLIFVAFVGLVFGTVTTADQQWPRAFLPFVVKQGAAQPSLGFLAGQVNVGPLCPVEPCPRPTPDVYSSRKLVLTPLVGSVIYVSLNTDGRFQAEVPATSYSVDLTDCIFLGCKRELPKQVTVKAGQVTKLDINIDTGIR